MVIQNYKKKLTFKYMKTLNDYFDKIVCINLDRRPDRWEESQKEFEKLNIVVERISALDGRFIKPPPGFKYPPGAFALLLTHIEIIKDAIKNNYKNFLLFEDDVAFIDNFYEKFNAKIDFLPDDWDMFYLGGNHILHCGWGNFQMITGDKTFVPNKSNYKTLDYELCKTPWTQCAHAVAFNSKFYNDLLNQIQKYPGEAIDNIHFFSQRDGYNAYAFIPSLAIQRSSFSDIENKHTFYAGSDLNSF